MTVPRRFEVSPEEAGERADVILARHLPRLSRARIQKLIGEGIITREGGRELKPGTRLPAGEALRLGEWEESGPRGWENLAAEPIPLSVVYEDAHLLLINKPPGLVVHPGAGRKQGTLVNALLHRYRELPETLGRDRPGIVHRLDRDTSGIILVAKDDFTQRTLSRDFEARRVRKEYRALVWGKFPAESMTLNGAIGRNPHDRKKMAVGGVRGRAAQTRVEVESRFPGFTLLRVYPETGRTHQIRVHLAALGHPVVGDAVYGRARRLSAGTPDAVKGALMMLKGFALHAYALRFRHPVTGEELSFSVDFPEGLRHLVRVLSELGKG